MMELVLEFGERGCCSVSCYEQDVKLVKYGGTMDKRAWNFYVLVGRANLLSRSSRGAGWVVMKVTWKEVVEVWERNCCEVGEKQSYL